MEKKKKKPYTKPNIIYEKKIEVLASVCNSTWTGPNKTCCMKGTCLKRQS